MRKPLAVLAAAVVLLVVCSVLPASAIEYDVRKMVLNRENVSLCVGETFTLKAEIAPFKADRTVTWVSSDESVVTVEEGKLTALSIGSADITVTSVQNPSVFQTAHILVVKPVESVVVSDQEVSLPAGETWDLIAYVYPEDATMQRPVWSSSDPKVAAVDENGVVTALKNGFSIITAAAADNLGAKAAVRIQVRNYEAVISEPGEFDVAFEMIEDEGTDEITKGTKVVKDVWYKTVTFENGKLEKASDTSVFPVAAGGEIVHMREIHNKKITKESRHFIFVRQSAVREAGSVPENSEGMILFRDIPWGLRYKEVKTLLSERKEKLKTPVMRNNLLWTQIDGEVTFGDFKAYNNGLSFTSSSANVQNLTANLQKTAFCMGDYYFEKSIPFENLKLNVMKTYGLPDNDTTNSSEECVWVQGNVTVRLHATPKYTQLQISYYEAPAEEETAEETAAEEPAAEEPAQEETEQESVPADEDAGSQEPESGLESESAELEDMDE